MRLPYMTEGVEGTGGMLRRFPEDFRVDEVPLYRACGEGEHVYVRLWKRGLATFEAVRRLAQSLQIREHAISYAGLKDARAVTTQWISVEGVSEEAVNALRAEKMAILEVRRHTNKLRIGHLLANRFSIVVRNARPGSFEQAKEILDLLARRGVPNYFGEQRFGSRLSSYRCGEAIVKKDYETFVKELLGGPSDREWDPYLKEARRLFDEGKLNEAYEEMPTRHRTEKKALHALIRFGDPERAFFAVPKRMRQMFLSSYQSHLFNRILRDRAAEIDRMQEGDLAYLHRNGAVFRVTDAAEAQRRCDAFEISPSGPIFGTHCPLAEEEPGRAERVALAETGLGQEDFDVGGGLRARGKRRSLRIPLRDIASESLEETAYRVEFTLPPGCFATVVMREILKS
ncbi:MAG: tRNA pseudouridine(13) synthase TruD [Planctomycetota bacterium]